MDRDAPWMILVGVAAVAIIVAAAVGAFGARETTTRSSPPGTIPDPAADGSSGVLFELRANGGFSLFGVSLSASTYEAYVGFIAPAGCVSRDDDGQERLLTEGECAGLPARGEVGGGGTTADGLNLVIVRVEVSRGCYEALTVGDMWPPDIEACES